jgi:hypothetical protein
VASSSWRIWVLLLALLILLVGCARQPDLTATPALPDHTLPFDRNSPNPRQSPASAFSLDDVPAGTVIVVHLQVPLSSSLAHSGDSFQAILEGPILLRGQSIAARGSLVTGKVLQAKSSDPSREAGYLRLALTEIAIAGRRWPLQTSSVFIKGATYDREASTPPVQLVGASNSRVTPATLRSPRILVREDAGVPADRSLTFRLSQFAANEHGGQ